MTRGKVNVVSRGVGRRERSEEKDGDVVVFVSLRFFACHRT